MKLIDELVKKGKLKKGVYSLEMCQKEYTIAQKDLDSAKKSYEDCNYKWATIQAYYAIFHAIRALVFKAGYREESHVALKIAFKELYVKTEQVSRDVYATLEKGMNLREMADYKESYSQNGSSRLIELVRKFNRDR